MNRAGMTLLEVLLAIAVLGVVVGVISTTTLTSVQQNAAAGGRTQAAQVLAYFGGRLAAGEAGTLEGPTWGYGELGAAFPELADAGGRTDPGFYRVAIDVLPDVGIGEATMPHYRVHVCWRTAGEEDCLRGDTAGPANAASGDVSPPGIE